MNADKRRKRARQLRDQGLSLRAIAKKIGVSHTRIKAYLDADSKNDGVNDSVNTKALEAKLLRRFANRSFDLSALRQFLKDDSEFDLAVQILTENAHSGEKIGEYSVKCLSFSLFM